MNTYYVGFSVHSAKGAAEIVNRLSIGGYTVDVKGFSNHHGKTSFDVLVAVSNDPGIDIETHVKETIRRATVEGWL